MPAPKPSSFDGNQVLQHAFEEASGRLRVDATLSPGGTSEIIINHTDDSIQLGDGTNLVGTNYGTAVNSLRTAAQVGNTTGQADFNTGNYSAQTLRTVTATDSPDAVSVASIDSKLKSNGNTILRATDISDNGGLEGTLIVGTTAVELKVGGSPLANRVLATLYNDSSNTVYWGYTNGVTTANGTPIEKKQFVVWDIGPNTSVYLIASSAGNNTRITESA